jgi:alcohol dehydrogenase (NADP+)
VCGSDVHTITGGWGEFNKPLCVGHEIVGKAIKVGKDVKTVKVGDRVGVGAQIWACLECDVCKSGPGGNENYCPQQVDTYNAPYPEGHGDGIISQGGYASHIRAHEYFTFPIPDAIETKDAAPMMCAGLTTYSPLYRFGAGPGKNIGILGIGGLGHFGILWAKAMGANVYAISHTPEKEKDALALGAKEFICTKDEKWTEKYKFKFDFILNCADMTNEFPMADYMSTLAVNGEFHNVGLPDKPLPEMMAQQFAPNGSKISGSHIGCRTEALEMLKLAAEKNVKPYIQTLDISEAGCKDAVEKVKTNDVRYRFTLVGFEKAFGQ